jgi:hypothetical protein
MAADSERGAGPSVTAGQDGDQLGHGRLGQAGEPKPRFVAHDAAQRQQVVALWHRSHGPEQQQRQLRH